MALFHNDFQVPCLIKKEGCQGSQDTPESFILIIMGCFFWYCYLIISLTPSCQVSVSIAFHCAMLLLKHLQWLPITPGLKSELSHSLNSEKYHNR